VTGRGCDRSFVIAAPVFALQADIGQLGFRAVKSSVISVAGFAMEQDGRLGRPETKTI
jgi:hypothetical protein